MGDSFGRNRTAVISRSAAGGRGEVEEERVQTRSLQIFVRVQCHYLCYCTYSFASEVRIIQIMIDALLGTSDKTMQYKCYVPFKREVISLGTNLKGHSSFLPAFAMLLMDGQRARRGRDKPKVARSSSAEISKPRFQFYKHCAKWG